MEMYLSTTKPFMSCSKSSCRNKPQKIVCRSCKAAETKTENFYKLLCLSSENASIDEIKRAYRMMALKYHPDVCQGSGKEESEKNFVKLNEAYMVLSDPVSREEYDHMLSLSDSMPEYWINKSDDRLPRKRWEEQLYELNRQASYRAKQEGSWGARMRDHNGKP